jgi:hypothetical protein
LRDDRARRRCRVRPFDHDGVGERRPVQSERLGARLDLLGRAQRR